MIAMVMWQINLLSEGRVFAFFRVSEPSAESWSPDSNRFATWGVVRFFVDDLAMGTAAGSRSQTCETSAINGRAGPHRNSCHPFMRSYLTGT